MLIGYCKKKRPIVIMLPGFTWFPRLVSGFLISSTEFRLLRFFHRRLRRCVDLDPLANGRRHEDRNDPICFFCARRLASDWAHLIGRPESWRPTSDRQRVRPISTGDFVHAGPFEVWTWKKTILVGFPQVFTEFCFALPPWLGFTVFYCFLREFRNYFTGFHSVTLGFIGFYWVLLGFTGFHWVLLDYTGFQRVLLGFIWFLLGFTEFHCILLCFTEFYLFLLGFTGFRWVLLGFAGFYWVLLFFLGFTGF